MIIRRFFAVVVVVVFGVLLLHLQPRLVEIKGQKILKTTFCFTAKGKARLAQIMNRAVQRNKGNGDSPKFELDGVSRKVGRQHIVDHNVTRDGKQL